jgi:hypothetical protein
MRELSGASIARIDPPGRVVPGEPAVLGVDVERLRIFDASTARRSRVSRISDG